MILGHEGGTDKMTQAVAMDTPMQRAPSGAAREVIVHISMAMMVIALGFVLKINLGFGTGFSVIAAICFYWALLLVHVSVRRGCALSALGETLDRLDSENTELKRFLGARFGPPRGMVPTWPGGPRVPMPQAMAQQQPAAPPQRAQAAPAGPSQRAASQPADPRTVTEPGPAAAVAREEKASLESTTPETPTQLIPVVAARTAGPPPLPAAQAAAPAAPAVRREMPAESHATLDAAEAPIPVVAGGLGSSREAEFAAMQSLIRELADQINGAAPIGSPEGAAKSTATPPVTAEIDPAEALREAADAMRSSLSAARAPASASASADYARLAKVAAAVEAHRIDLYLDPILGLDDRRARHFEVSVRLRTEDGNQMEQSEFESDVIGSGLLPRIDAEKITRSAHVAGQLRDRGSSTSLFSGIAGESLTDSAFRGSVARALGPDSGLSGRYVMAIAQSEIRGFGPAHWDAVSAMAQHGLRFALVDVMDLDLDFEALKGRGFDFVRLDASVFLEGLPAPHGIVPAADLCRHLSGLGFSLIVGRIADETMLAKIYGFGAVLGQGMLFGGPRPVQMPSPAHAASAQGTAA